MEIIFEDDEVCVINKPAGVVVNNAESVKEETVQDWFAQHCHPERSRGIPPRATLGRDDKLSEFEEKGGVVHRLDKDTSGVMILAKTLKSYESLKSQFLERTTQKTYVALVHGIMKEKSGIVSLPIERHSKNKHKFAIGTDLSRTAITEWSVIDEKKGFSLVELKPHTGRTHQLRVHLKHLNHPIVADPIYGGKGCKEDIKWCPRLFLHAQELEIVLARDGQKHVFRAELPVDLKTALATLE